MEEGVHKRPGVLFFQLLSLTYGRLKSHKEVRAFLLPGANISQARSYYNSGIIETPCSFPSLTRGRQERAPAFEISL